MLLVRIVNPHIDIEMCERPCPEVPLDHFELEDAVSAPGGRSCFVVVLRNAILAGESLDFRLPSTYTGSSLSR